MISILNLLSSAAATAPDAQNSENLFGNLTAALEILWKGMLAIVVVVGIIMAVTYLMQFISKKAEDKKAAEAPPSANDGADKNA